MSVPDNPNIISVISGNGQATVSWLAPISDGGSSITSYTVHATPGSRFVTTIGTITTGVITGLTNGSYYTFTVVATNTNGTSSASPPESVLIGMSVHFLVNISAGTGAHALISTGNRKWWWELGGVGGGNSSKKWWEV